MQRYNLQLCLLCGSQRKQRIGRTRSPFTTILPNVAIALAFRTGVTLLLFGGEMLYEE